MKAANMIRNKIFKKHYTFIGPLKDEQYKDKTLSFLVLFLMVLGGTNIKNQMKNNYTVKTAAISIIKSKLVEKKSLLQQHNTD